MVLGVLPACIFHAAAALSFLGGVYCYNAKLATHSASCKRWKELDAVPSLTLPPLHLGAGHRTSAVFSSPLTVTPLAPCDGGMGDVALNLALPRLPSLTRQTRKKSRTPSLIDKTTRDRRSTPHQLHCHAKLTPTRAKLVQRPSESSSMHLLLTLDLAAGRPDLQPPRLACNSSNIHHFFFCVKDLWPKASSVCRPGIQTNKQGFCFCWLVQAR